MDVLKLKFDANDKNDMLEVDVYEIGESLKERYVGERGNNVEFINMKVSNVNLSNVSDSLFLKYARNLSFDSSNDSNIDQIKSKKTGNFPTKGEIIFKKETLAYFQLNFVHMSYGNELDFGDHVYKIPIEFLFGKDEIKKNFKFFLEYEDQSHVDGDDSITVYFKAVEGSG